MLSHHSVANECLEKIERYPGDVTEQTYKREIFYYYAQRRCIADRIPQERTLLRRDALRKCIGRSVVTGRDRSSIFVSRAAAITRFRAVIDNAYLGLCGLLCAFGATFLGDVASIPGHKIIPSYSIQPCSINRFDRQTRIPRQPFG